MTIKQENTDDDSHPTSSVQRDPTQCFVVIKQEDIDEDDILIKQEDPNQYRATDHRGRVIVDPSEVIDLSMDEEEQTDEDEPVVAIGGNNEQELAMAVDKQEQDAVACLEKDQAVADLFHEHLLEEFGIDPFFSETIVYYHGSDDWVSYSESVGGESQRKLLQLAWDVACSTSTSWYDIRDEESEALTMLLPTLQERLEVNQTLQERQFPVVNSPK